MQHAYQGYVRDPHGPRFIVVYGLQWQILERLPVEPGGDLVAAMAATIADLAADGWEAECDAAWGFCFVRKGLERRLVSLTARDPLDRRVQSFNPFRKPGA